jgi:hypothetical protein
MFIEEEKHDRATYRTLWKLSELRQRVKKNEEELIARIRSNDRYAIATV